MRRIKFGNNGQSIIAAILVVLIASVMGLLAVSLLGGESANTLNYMYSQEALFVAEGGLEYYAEQLQNDDDWTSPPTQPSNKPLGGGTFIITTQNAEMHEIDVTSTASITGLYDDATKKVVRVVTAHITRYSAPGNIPDTFYYATYALQNIELQNSTNGIINGDLGAGQWVSGEENWQITGTVTEQMTLDFPSVDFAKYEAMEGMNIEDGNFTFQSGQTYNGYYYVKGNATIEDNVTINGGIVCEGMINMRHADGITLNATTGMPALVAAGPIDASNASGMNVAGRGLVYTEQGLNVQNATSSIFNGTAVIYRNLNVKNTDRVTLNFDTSIIDNPPAYFKAKPKIQNWDEVY